MDVVPDIADERPFDAAQFRSVVGSFCSGVTVVTACLAGELIGMTCQSFFSLSLDPPLVAFSPSAASKSYPKIRQAGRFAVNILSANQEDLARQMARSGIDRWNDVEHRPGLSGAPVIRGVAAVIECDFQAEHPAGDHLLVVGRVRALSQESTADPLVFFRSAFGTLASIS
ncbi:flavin reductase [Nakamurella sp. YIM 132087]|uniref:Flavin reductase n=1 Tax=Nakamurella alba TaxID=2665158 RepID=A0A7K1FGF7_9ACTN|nr:flavin reductase family protein [Nakamurella alba]MTD12569.1 flavin reductase [Nakamurella alba]